MMSATKSAAGGWVTRDEAAEILGVDERTFRYVQPRNSAMLPKYTNPLTRRVRFRRADAENLAAARLRWVREAGQ